MEYAASFIGDRCCWVRQGLFGSSSTFLARQMPVLAVQGTPMPSFGNVCFGLVYFFWARQGLFWSHSIYLARQSLFWPCFTFVARQGLF